MLGVRAMTAGNTEATGHPRAWFVTTHWSVVLAADDTDTTRARDALGRLFQIYWYPLYAYVRRRGYSPEDAQDLTQAFFAQMLEQHRIGAADQRRGRFRTFLLSSLSHFLANEWDKARAQKRGGAVVTVPLQLNSAETRYGLEPVDNHTPEQSFEKRWALSLLDSVLSELGGEYASAGKADLFAALSPCLVGDRAAQPYAALAGTLRMSESGVKSTVHRLRQRYRQLLREQIAHTVSAESEVDAELNYLFTVLART